MLNRYEDYEETTAIQPIEVCCNELGSRIGDVDGITYNVECKSILIMAEGQELMRGIEYCPFCGERILVKTKGM